MITYAVCGGGSPPHLCSATASLQKPLMGLGSSALTLHDANIGHAAVTGTRKNRGLRTYSFQQIPGYLPRAR